MIGINDVGTNAFLNDEIDSYELLNDINNCNHAIHSIQSIHCNTCQHNEIYHCTHCPLTGTMLCNNLKMIHSTYANGLHGLDY